MKLSRTILTVHSKGQEKICIHAENRKLNDQDNKFDLYGQVIWFVPLYFDLMI